MRRSLTVPAHGGGGCGRGGRLGALVARHPSRGPRKLCPRPLEHYGDGRGSLCGALGPAAKPALRPPPRPDFGTRPRPGGPGREGFVRTPSAALRFCGVLAAASSHDRQRARLSGGAWGSLCLLAGPGFFLVGWGGAESRRPRERGRRSLASRYLPSPPPTEAFL